MEENPQSHRRLAIMLIIPVIVMAMAIPVIVSTRGDDEPQQPPMLVMPPLQTLEVPPFQPVQITPVDLAQMQNPPVQVTPLVTAVPTATSTPNPIPSLPRSAEQEAARALLNDQPGVYGFVVLAEDGSVISAYNSFTPFITASTYKLVLMAEIYRRVEMGEMSLDDYLWLDPADFDAAGRDLYFQWAQAGTEAQVSELLFAVGAYSSNIAAMTLLDYTTPERLRQTAADIGMVRTYLFVKPWDVPYWPPEPGIDSSEEDMATAIQFIEESAYEGVVNITTPYDMAVYQLGLVNDTVISPWVSEQIVNILAQQTIRDRLPVYNWDVFVINKPGNLTSVVNDTGVLYLPDGARAVAMFSESVIDEEHATEILGLLGMIAAGNTDIW